MYVYACMYVCSQICMSVCVCMYVSMSVYMHGCMYVCIHMYQVCHVTVDIFDTSLNNYGFHIANICHTGIMLNGYIDPTFLHVRQIQPTPLSIAHVIYATYAN